MAVAEKRTLDENVYSSKHIVMDIEGTTTSISFVKDTLFPYVRKNLDGYVKSHWDEEEFKSILALLKDQAAEDKKAEVGGTIEIPSGGSEDDLKAAVVKNVLWQMDADRKTTGLKKLQGHIWRNGYKTGELKGHLFADVAPALKEWAKDGRKLYVYSSGSVDAQKLLFGYSTEGDLTELFSDFFDTEVGVKTEVESYKSIVKKLDCNADEVLFLTDMPKEASAARSAGLPVVLLEREGNEPIASDLRKEFSAVSSFGELTFETTSKKQKVDIDEKETEPAEEKASAMDVDSMEESNAVVEVPDAQVGAMDVDKKVEEPQVVESTKPSVEPEAKEDAIVKSQENGSAEEKSDAKSEVPNAEAVVKSQENGTAEEKSKQDSEVPKAETVEKETKSPIEEKKEVSDISAVSENSEKVLKDEKVVNTEMPSSLDEDKEKPSEDVTATEQIKESKKTEVLEQKTEDKNIEKMETEPENVLPKEDTKTEETETKPEAVVESPAVETSEVEEKESIKDSKAVMETATEVKEQKETITEVNEKAKTTEVKEDKEEVSQTTATSTAESEVPKKSPENEDSKSENTEGKKEELETDEMNGGKDKMETEDKEKLNGVANGNKDAATNGTVENGHSKEGKDGIPEVIVSKNAPQIENGTTDAGVAMEA